MKTKNEEKKLIDVCTNLGLTVESSSPVAEVRDVDKKTGRGWPCISYTVQIKRGNRLIWTGPYRLGIGHVAHKKVTDHIAHVMGIEQAAMNLLRKGKEFADQRLAAEVATKIARYQKVSPKLDDVMSNLLTDGSPHLQHQTFEEWCSEFGYDTDSIKARKTYDLCVEEGMAIARAFTPAELEQLQAAAANH